MKSTLTLAATLLVAALSAADTAPGATAAGAPAISGIRVRAVWWQSPPQPLQLYAEGKDGKPRPVRVLPMCPLESFEATAEKEAVLLRRIEPDPADPKAKPTWVPYATAALPPGSRDLLMLLLPTPDGKACLSRLLPMDEADLRWGGTRLANFTAKRLVGQVDGKPFAVASGDSIPLPFVAKRRAVVDIILAAENQKGGRELVFSSKGIFTPAKRTLLFILEKPDGGYEARAIDEPNPDPKAYEDSEPGR